MARMVTADHFGGNIVLTKDSVSAESSWTDMLSQISFSNFRYPGGAITEDQTWDNGGLERVFGPPMDEADPSRVMTIRESFELAIDHGAGVTIVVPTFQFYDTSSGAFDHVGFDYYLDELGSAIHEYPQLTVNAFEIGNEFWARVTPHDYGTIANYVLPKLDEFRTDMQADLGSDWHLPMIGIQAGSAWKSTSDVESREIANAISMENRGIVDAVFQHRYPDVSQGLTGQVNNTVKAMVAYENLPGFKDDLHLSMSEINVGKNTAIGVNQAGHWIEMIHQYIDAGVDEFLHWGLNYDVQSNKFYDTRLAPEETDGGSIKAIATPQGQIYDIAQNYLIGMQTISDVESTWGMNVPWGVGITGFEGDGQRVVFLHNDYDGDSATIDLGALVSDVHVATYHLVGADSPYTDRDESLGVAPSKDSFFADSRGDMTVKTGAASPTSFTLGPSEVMVVVVSQPGVDQTIEGAHHITDPRTGNGNDVIFGGDGRNIILGHDGDDMLVGGDDRDVIVAGQGDDTLIGGDGNDILISDRGYNILDGGGGDDVLVANGGRADDFTEMTGGDGDNIFLTGGAQNVLIHDFGVGDILGLNGVFVDGDELTNASRMVDGDIVITLPGGQQITLSDAANLSEGLAGQVLDFMPPERVEEVTDRLFEQLNDDQIAETWENISGLGKMADGSFPWADPQPLHDRYGDPPGAHQGEETPDPPSQHPDHPGEGQDHDTDGGEGHGDGTAEVPSQLPDQPDEGQDIEDDVLGEDDDYQPEPDYYPDDDASKDGGGGGDSSCFIATAAYGDGSHPDVVALRAFRDHHLRRFALGRIFIAVYWVVGPKMARVTKPQNLHAAVTRAILSRFVRILISHGLTTPRE